MPSEAIAERILRFLQTEDYRPRELRDLAAAMGVGEGEMGDFHDACKALMRTGRIVMGARNTITLPPPPGKIVGTFRANPKGFGFVIPDEANSHGDIYVPPGKTGDAITGDTVEVRVVKRGKRGGQMLYEGRIIEVIRRGQSRFVGELCQQLKRWLVIPDGNVLHTPIQVDDPGAKGAKPGDQVVVELLKYPSERQEASGVIVKVLGRRGDPGVDTLSIIEQYQLPGDFDEPLLEEARDAATAYDPKKAAEGREDLRDLTIITIDPVDARDFDDAISLTRKNNGMVELGVHIADVAAFVPEGGALDREAQERSNSVYLPRLVIPMLPELLSNGVCSLQERQPRLTKSAFITYDRNANVKKTRVANTIIRSTRRLTYEQAQAVLDGKKGRMSAKVVALLKEMEDLARRIRKRRLKKGMLELDLPDIELVFDDEGRATDVVPEDTSFSHKLIEMFMVEANEAVARLLTDVDVPHLRRIHDEPRKLGSGVLRRFIALLGHELPADADRFDLQRLLEEVRGTNEAFAVNLAILKSMQRAEYAPVRIGHYALASEAYSHFTSPIRRYPDLTIHRLIDSYVRGDLKRGKSRQGIPTERDLVRVGRRCTVNEQRAESAERELKLVLILRMLEAHIGENFDGIVTGVANFGVFVQLEKYLTDGLLRFDQLPEDWWEVDSTKGCVIGERSGKRITVGDRLKVTISRIHVPTRRMELALAEPIAAPEEAPARHDRRGQDRPRGRKPSSRKGRRRGGRAPAEKPAKTGKPGGNRSRGKRSSRKRRR